MFCPHLIFVRLLPKPCMFGSLVTLNQGCFHCGSGSPRGDWFQWSNHIQDSYPSMPPCGSPNAFFLGGGVNLFKPHSPFMHPFGFFL